VRDELIIPGDFQYRSGYHAANLLLDLPNPPTAIFAGNDLMAIGCISSAAERGLLIPKDISVVGFDDVKLASFTNPPLTTIAQPKREIGSLAVKMLIARIADINAPIRTEQLDTRLVLRRSTTERSMEALKMGSLS
jgi:LacI family transcriptional regulator